jgi:hypothetical protein
MVRNHVGNKIKSQGWTHHLFLLGRFEGIMGLRVPRHFSSIVPLLPSSTKTTTTRRRKIKFFIFLFDHCFLFCIFSGGSIQHVMGHASVLLLPIPLRRWKEEEDLEKNKNNTCPRMEHEAMKPVENSVWWWWSEKDGDAVKQRERKQHHKHYSSLDWFSYTYTYTHKCTGGFHIEGGWKNNLFSLLYA